ncbi:HDOD domain-containing protein [uncultured Porticoccus sp.]|uniref:EAL and HDOD domain-containing protein n=1 Tax=uncultured Porticoccus sp. TaxID=1256050 RepID=UPI0030DCBCE8
MTNIVVGRQEILDSNMSIHAYELLFRGQDFDLSSKDGSSEATNQIITDTILEIGLNNVVGNSKAFINFTAQNLLEKIPLYLPKDRIVIEVLENVAVDLRIISALKELSNEGYTLALDDFQMSSEWRPLLEFAHIVKLDVLANPLQETLDLIKELKPYNLTILAEKVETHEMFELFRDAGCELFQGFFFSKPNTVKGRRVGVNQLAAVKLLTLVNDPDVTFSELASIVSQDAGLSYKLLRYINSAFFGLRNKMESITHAVSYLGLNEVRRWVNVLTLATLSGKPGASFQQALIRGKMCELTALQCGEQAGNLFLIGMLSSLDSMLDIPLAEALEQMPIGEQMRQAILFQEGPAGDILNDVLSYERWELAHENLTCLSPEELGSLYLKSIEWAKDAFGQL